MPKLIRCILLIDDDPDDNFLHRLVIEESGLCEEVREATTAAEALRYLAQPDTADHPFPSLVLLDVNMPGMNGFEFLDEYPRWVHNPSRNPLVLLLTAAKNPAEQTRAQTYRQIAGYHVKPLTDELLREVAGRYF